MRRPLGGVYRRGPVRARRGSQAMTRFGYTLMTEQSGPRQLVEYAQRAEAVGFDFEVSSDHYSPWLARVIPAQSRVWMRASGGRRYCSGQEGHAKGVLPRGREDDPPFRGRFCRGFREGWRFDEGQGEAQSLVQRVGATK